METLFASGRWEGVLHLLGEEPFLWTRAETVSLRASNGLGTDPGMDHLSQHLALVTVGWNQAAPSAPQSSTSGQG